MNNDYCIMYNEGFALSGDTFLLINVIGCFVAQAYNLCLRFLGSDGYFAITQRLTSLCSAAQRIAEKREKRFKREKQKKEKVKI